MLNFVSFFILLAFVVVMQAVYPSASVSPQPFTGLELLTGAVSKAQAPPGQGLFHAWEAAPLPHCNNTPVLALLGPRTTGAVGALRLALRCQAKQEAASTAEVTVGPIVCFPAGLLHKLTAVLWLLQQRDPQ